jgi:hypothetical protein
MNTSYSKFQANTNASNFNCKIEDSTQDWENMATYEETKEDHDNYFLHNSLLVTDNKSDTENPALRYFDYFCMLCGVLSKL